MKRKRILLPSIGGTLIVSLLFAGYHLCWGKLFSYSPVIIGFSEHELAAVSVFVQRGAEEYDLSVTDALIPEVETFHDLHFTSKPRLFIFRDDESYLKRSMTRARFIAYPNSSLLIAPWAVQESKSGKISMEIYLRHELSHTLLYQNMGVVAAYVEYPRWLMEGVAMCSADQMGTSFYPGKRETYRLMTQGNFMPPNYYNTANEERVELHLDNKIAFIYSELGCYVDYLIQTQGKGKFLLYMKRLLVDSDHDAVFSDVFGVRFETSLQEFQKFAAERSIAGGK